MGIAGLVLGIITIALWVLALLGLVSLGTALTTSLT